nr:GAF domain-containing protein [Bacteroidota bacterium]
GEILLKRTEELTFLYKVGKQLRQTLDLDKIFNFMYKDISKIMRCDSIVLSYYESDTNLIQCMFAMDNEKVLDTSNFPSVSLNRESGRTQSKVILSKAPSLIKDYQAYVKSSRKSYYINNSGALQKEQDKSKDANLIRSALIVPLIMNEEVVGVVQVFSYKVNSYTENDLKMLNALAVQIAVAVNNALLYKRAQDEISERKRIEGKVVRYLKELERSNKELEQFAYVASHDLQEPLRMVSSFTQLLKERYRDKLDESGNEFIAYTIDGAKRMQRMIDDLLSYSRVTTRGKKFETVDFNSAFYQAIDNLQLLIEENNVKITKDKLPTMDADESQIIRLFQNLLDNAIKFKNERTPVINIRTKKRSEEFIISINDNGVGIDPEYKNSVFQVFKRLNGKNKYSGTGIGLAICKRIVERHGGKIWLDSTLREGSTFYFSIPKKSKT